ncbi:MULTISPECIES: hypothetical protein [Ruminococcus]|uniref:FeoB-associated Cys-rich membrane protein n=1 Tax=Ruminococcus albus 8 TaxID=246199 RepID=E9SDB7_RUMAL|nr:MULTISPECIES: hypothetical protein [Ruminococcus]EGC02730.1 hypothetical protein CUS_5070 [Ruminococcus albus 8]
MNAADIILIVLITAAVIGAVVHCVKKKGSCNCGCCTGSCPNCKK